MATQPNFTDSTWEVVAAAQFDGAGNDDILWRNTLNADLILWEMDGADVVATSELPSLGPAFTHTVVGDFDGDGEADVWLRADDGSNRLLLNEPGAVPVPITPAAPVWDLSAVFERNGDGKDDVLWFNTTTAQLTSWLMDGTSVTVTFGSTFASAYAANDSLLAAFNGTDAKTFDSLWLDTSAGQYDITSYDAGVRTITDSFQVEAGNEFVNSLDYNGDGNVDFLFRDGSGSDTGSVEIVFSNGFSETARLSYAVPTFAGVAFEAGGDFDGDGIGELIMRDTVGGGTSLYNVVGGSASSQTLVGSDGNDLIDGSNGNDRVFGNDGDDIIVDRGTTTVNDDTLLGGAGDDLIDGGIEDDSLWGGTGNDVLQGQSGDDLLVGGPGDDTLRAGNGTDVLFGDDGDDYLIGGSFGFDHMKGGAGNDILQGTGDRTLQEGGAGDDQLLGSSAFDYLFGGSGDDYLVGGLSLDTLDGGSGNDILIGTDVAGTSGTDDTLIGGSGNDFFYLGNDDTNYYVGSGRAFIKDFSTFSDFVMLNGSVGNYSFVDTGSNIEIRQSSDADVIAVVENVANASDVASRAIYIG